MKTLAEIGDMLGVTRERVRQIEAKALKKLRPPMYATGEWLEMDIDNKIEAFIKYHEDNSKRMVGRRGNHTPEAHDKAG